MTFGGRFDPVLVVLFTTLITTVNYIKSTVLIRTVSGRCLCRVHDHPHRVLQRNGDATRFTTLV